MKYIAKAIVVSFAYYISAIILLISLVLISIPFIPIEIEKLIDNYFIVYIYLLLVLFIILFSLMVLLMWLVNRTSLSSRLINKYSVSNPLVVSIFDVLSSIISFILSSISLGLYYAISNKSTMEAKWLYLFLLISYTAFMSLLLWGRDLYYKKLSRK